MLLFVIFRSSSVKTQLKNTLLVTDLGEGPGEARPAPPPIPPFWVEKTNKQTKNRRKKKSRQVKRRKTAASPLLAQGLDLPLVIIQLYFFLILHRMTSRYDSFSQFEEVFLPGLIAACPKERNSNVAMCLDIEKSQFVSANFS